MSSFRLTVTPDEDARTLTLTLQSEWGERSHVVRLADVPEREFGPLRDPRTSTTTAAAIVDNLRRQLAELTPENRRQKAAWMLESLGARWGVRLLPPAFLALLREGELPHRLIVELPAADGPAASLAAAIPWPILRTGLGGPLLTDEYGLEIEIDSPEEIAGQAELARFVAFYEPREGEAACDSGTAFDWPASPPTKDDPDMAPATDGDDAPDADAGLFWNTRFPGHDSVLEAHALFTGIRYTLETALELHSDDKSVTSTGIDPRDIIPPGRDRAEVLFHIEARGALLRLPGEEDRPGESWIASGWLPCSLDPDDRPASFRVTLVTESPGPVAVKLLLNSRERTIASQTLELTAVARPTGTATSTSLTSADLRGSLPNAATLILGGTQPDQRLRMSLLAGGQFDDMESASTFGAITPMVCQWRNQLVALSKNYPFDPRASGDDLGLALTEPGPVLVRFARVGAAMFEAFFGDPYDAGTDAELAQAGKTLAALGTGDSGQHIQIVSELLPVPWAVMYDGRAWARHLEERGDPDHLRYKKNPSELEEEDVDIRRFWGYRFSIERYAHVSMMPPHADDHAPLRIHACLNRDLGSVGDYPLLDKQSAFFAGLGGDFEVESIGDAAQLEKFLRESDSQPSDLLYFFCHAEASKTLDKHLMSVAESRDLQAGLIVDGKSPKVTIQKMRNIRVEALPHRPLVIINACSSAEGDVAYQSPFLDLFLGTYRARGFVGTDWKVPKVFADAFSLRVLEGLLVDHRPIGQVFHLATRELLEAHGNPFGLIYALYARPDLRMQPRRGTAIDIARRWQAVSEVPPPRTVEFGGIRWRLVDEIDFGDEASERDHDVAIHDATEEDVTSSGKLKYPRGDRIEDSGRLHVGGYVQYKIHDLAPGRPAVLLQRGDLAGGDHEIEYAIDGEPIGEVRCTGSDPTFRWRNWPFVIAAERVDRTSLVIRQTARPADRDTFLYHLWVYQPT